MQFVNIFFPSQVFGSSTRMQSNFGPYPNSEKKRKDLAKYLFVTETTDIFPSKSTDKNCVFNGSSSIFRFLTAITDKAEPCIHIHSNSKIFLHYYCYLLCRNHTCMLLTANTLPFLMSRCTQQTCTNMNQIFTCFVLIPLLFSNQYVCECVGRG